MRALRPLVSVAPSLRSSTFACVSEVAMLCVCTRGRKKYVVILSTFAWVSEGAMLCVFNRVESRRGEMHACVVSETAHLRG